MHVLGPAVVPFYPFLGEGSPTKIDYRKQLVPLFPLYWRCMGGKEVSVETLKFSS